MCFVYIGFEIINNVQDLSVYAVVKGIRVKSASGQVGLSQLGRVKSAGSSRPYI